jgi:hypothetical protein
MAVMVLNLASLTPVSSPDLNSDKSTPIYTKGGLTFMQDAFGPKIFRYGHNRSGSVQAQSELASRVGDANGVKAVTDITSGTTLSATKVGAWTADLEVGALFYVFDNDDSAGAAPEGEVSIVKSNTADKITLEDSMPLTVALAANDDVRTMATYGVDDSVDGDFAYAVFGVVVGRDGISDKNYGFYQSWGVCPRVLVLASSALTVGEGVVADAARVGTSGADAATLHVGVALMAKSADMVLDIAPIQMTLDFVGVSAGA